eukprot:scaffold84536_cov26-Prasinocladus_malaysianus.AAC.3
MQDWPRNRNNTTIPAMKASFCYTIGNSIISQMGLSSLVWRPGVCPLASIPAQKFGLGNDVLAFRDVSLGSGLVEAPSAVWARHERRVGSRRHHRDAAEVAPAVQHLALRQGTISAPCNLSMGYECK